MKNIDSQETMFINVTCVCSQPLPHSGGRHRTILNVFYETVGVTHTLSLELDELPNGHIIAYAHRYDADGNYVENTP